MPIYCTSIEVDPIIDGHCVFKGVKHLDDKAFPMLKVTEISLPKSDIKYYLKGFEETVTEINKKIDKDMQVSDISKSSPEKEKKAPIAEENEIKRSSWSRRRLRFKDPE